MALFSPPLSRIVAPSASPVSLAVVLVGRAEQSCGRTLVASGHLHVKTPLGRAASSPGPRGRPYTVERQHVYKQREDDPYNGLTAIPNPSETSRPSHIPADRHEHI
ncbi:hypothetical protein BU26DRAFT_554998 [Trematosphaeria pertusa]|uniref:Uncharacterized protein n=1 Tax=Trematosphaeria pertusa TaxID=390896 RepID=A0A6A6HZS4_9PLEO|nr:uncharacterized protein BU26DRAFT_554998 [Trematosphaeria pertusa]KAF2243536.1 hypothetical protein BU26DRAFT_554998 [Trematosphaeria pertusa]